MPEKERPDNPLHARWAWFQRVDVDARLVVYPESGGGPGCTTSGFEILDSEPGLPG